MKQDEREIELKFGIELSTNNLLVFIYQSAPKDYYLIIFVVENELDKYLFYDSHDFVNGVLSFDLNLRR